MRRSDAVSEEVAADERYNPFTGLRIVAGVDDAVPTAAQLGLEPPRFCEQCGRRMIVQVSPDGWWAKCSRHGVLDSAELGRR
ncbi:hypothetical protein M2284_003710 [Rhodococcus sp. LBL1]|uniref:Biotin synthase auxiliary protein n=1 Tax=Prescottella agglutinans TaxID=1644129 RepID=A0ABT6M7W8_9NOCA|nr:hypothetical protein [Prescottella agglutinans]MDH6279974.1 hypothetical protein [Prescottella agglutinans]MDH6679488.1 hypothetical protein [Rhodococcus sp. LBL1]MDH6685373.1 hypothetical protein [Rhodococcus sp. LBL2]